MGHAKVVDESQKSVIKYTYALVKFEASKYPSRRAFCAGSNGAYRAANRNDWADDVCAHMPHTRWNKGLVLRLFRVPHAKVISALRGSERCWSVFVGTWMHHDGVSGALDRSYQ